MGGRCSRHYEIEDRIDGTTAVVTGSSSGIGRVTAKELYKAGARVIMACIEESSAAERVAEGIRKEVEASHPQLKVGALIVKKLDLSSLESIRKFADDLNESEEKINILINNAGILTRERRVTKDGFELTYVTNYLGHFYLTCLLLPKMLGSTPARIVNVASIAHASGRMHWDDLTLEKNFSMFGAYAQSKLAVVLITRELASRLEGMFNVLGTGVKTYSLHPGILPTTNISNQIKESSRSWRYVLNFLSIFMIPLSKTQEQGAATTLFCALDASVAEESGFYYKDCAREEMALQARSERDAKKLWDESLKMVGLHDFHIKKDHKING
ncbi:unnamed protein product [Bemisia tabaci]|uniref:Retinol dehydrogenase 13 n=1 Tax=Bemisia tabaci TaxID=7038 RepID=A0A9P0AIX0_BEMTA|nr:unnamed protein product [Bemisia tabaci]